MAAAGAGAATADDPTGDAVSDDLATVPDKSRSVINGPVARMQAPRRVAAQPLDTLEKMVSTTLAGKLPQIAYGWRHGVE